MTTTQAEPRVCGCGQGPNVARCRAGHLERTKAKERTDCPHRENGVKCGQRTNVLKTTATLPAADRPAGDQADDLESRWAAEEPPGSWREMLAEASGGEPCGNEDCPCDDPPVRYTGAHTAEVCPACGPVWCWSESPRAQDRAGDHAEAEQRKAVRTGQASAMVPQAELDERDRELRRRKNQLLRIIRAALGDDRLADESRDDLEWFEEQLGRASTAERVVQLEEQLASVQIRRRGWSRSVLELDDYDVVGEDQADEDGAAGELPGPERRVFVDPFALAARAEIPAPVSPAATGVLCELCLAGGRQGPAAARVRSPNMPGMVPERDVCLEHYRFYAAVIEPTTYGVLEVVKQYASVLEVRSIRAGLLNGSRQ